MKNLRRNFKNQKGFNLIELMIVIAIIALLIAVGIPAYQSMVKNGNEVSAIQSIQNIKTLQVGYAGKHQGKFAPSFKDLVTSAGLDDRFNKDEPEVNGYTFKMTLETPTKYNIVADPQVGQGERHFYFDSTISTTKQKEGTTATAADPSV